jgi:hypothetical protein
MLHMEKNSSVCQDVLYNFPFKFRFLLPFFSSPLSNFLYGAQLRHSKKGELQQQMQ